MSMLRTGTRGHRHGVAAGGDAGISVRGLVKSFGAQLAVDGVDLDVRNGDFVVVLGPSGCGKTTVLRMIAGLERVDRGTVVIDGETVASSSPRFSRPPEARNLGMVFQTYAVWPHMTVEQNVAFPLKLRRVRASVGDNRLKEVLELVGLSHVVKRYPSELSGGQQQRVALARALVAEPRAVLFDEPLSNLDTKLRAQLRSELSQIMVARPFTGLYVTHDLTEAMGLASQIVVMRDGKVAQVGTPEHIYHRPVNRFVAEFMGFNNFVEGRVIDNLPEGVAIETPVLGRLQVASGDPILRGGDPCLVAIRPTALLVAAVEGTKRGDGRGHMRTSRFLGETYTGTVEVDGHLLEARSTTSLPAAGIQVSVSARPDAGLIALPLERSNDAGTRGTGSANPGSG